MNKVQIKVLWIRGLAALMLVTFFGLAGAEPVYAASAPAEAADTEGPFYLELKPLSVPVRRKNGSIKYYMFMTVSLEFDELEKISAGKKMIPRLRDAFLGDMNGRSVLHKDASKGVDFELIKKRLLKQASKVLGKKAPDSILVVKVYKGT